MRSSIGNTANDPLFVASVAGGNVVPAGTATDPQVINTAYLPAGTDRSGTAGTTSATLAAANSTRRNLFIQNVSANNIGINEFGNTAAIGTPGTYTIPAGGSARVSTNRAVTVIASAASSAYTATES